MYWIVPLNPLDTVAVGGRVATIDGAIVAMSDASSVLRPVRRRARGQPEVEQLHVRTRRPGTAHQHHVAGLQVAMRDAGTVCAIERLADLNRDRQRLVHRQRSGSTDAVGERLAFEELEHQVVEIAVAADVVNGADVRIVQRGNGARLFLEATPGFRVTRPARRSGP